MHRIIINKITQNTIFATWEIDRCYNCNSFMTSSAFTMMSDGTPIPFTLTIICREYFSISLHQITGRVGRAVACIAVKTDSSVNAMKIYFTEKWDFALDSFYDIGRLPPCTSEIGDLVTISLKIDCKITWFGFVEVLTTPKPPLPPLSIANVPFDNTVMPDFTIIVGGKELLAHKTILARNSPVLLAMFESPMKESKENKIIIEDIEYPTMELILRIMYTGESEALNDVDTALAVLEAAEKYQMPMIKSLCECKLQLRIRADNVLMLLEEADKYNALKLCETCVAYVMAIRNGKISCEFQKISQKPNVAIAFVNALTDQLSLTPIKNCMEKVSGLCLL